MLPVILLPLNKLHSAGNVTVQIAVLEIFDATMDSVFRRANNVMAFWIVTTSLTNSSAVS